MSLCDLSHQMAPRAVVLEYAPPGDSVTKVASPPLLALTPVFGLVGSSFPCHP